MSSVHHQQCCFGIKMALFIFAVGQLSCRECLLPVSTRAETTIAAQLGDDGCSNFLTWLVLHLVCSQTKSTPVSVFLRFVSVSDCSLVYEQNKKDCAISSSGFLSLFHYPASVSVQRGTVVLRLAVKRLRF